MPFGLSHRRLLDYALIAISIAMGLYHMWMIVFGAPEAVLFRGTHLLFAIVLIFLLYRFRSQTEDMALAAAAGGEKAAALIRLPHLIDYVLVALATAPILYLFVYYDYIVNRTFYVDDPDGNEVEVIAPEA